MFGTRILILIPHPDDEVVGCGTLIERAHATGAETFALALTTGVPSTDRLWPWQRLDHQERIARRYDEYDRATTGLGLVDVGRLRIPTRTLKDHLHEALSLVSRAIQSVRPDRLWAPAYEGGHQDHDSANFLASLVRRRVEVWEFSEYSFSGGTVRSNQFTESRPGQITIELTLSEQRRKQALLAGYRSERKNLRHIRTQEESIRPLPDYDYARPPHELPLFYQRFQWVPYHPRIDQTRPHEVCEALCRFRATVNPGVVG